MYCQNCGTEVTDGNRFCSNCGQPMGQPKKNGGVIAVIVVAVIVLLLIGSVAVMILVDMFSDKDSGAEDSDDRNSRQESVEDSGDRRESVEMEEEDREEYAMEVAEDYWKDFLGMIGDVFTADSAHEFINNIEGIEDFFYDRYPDEIAQAIYGGDEYNEFREMMEELKEMSPSELEEEFDEGVGELREQGSAWEQLSEAMKIKATDAEEFDEDELEEIKEEIEKHVGKELEDFDWGYKVKAEVSVTFYGETETEEGCFYVLCVDDKCSIYATESDGDVAYITEESLF